jgi:hypothetical protein
LKLKCDEPLSSFAFNFNLRRYDLERLERRLQTDVTVIAGQAWYLHLLSA